MTDRDKEKVIEQLEKVSDHFFSIWRDSTSEKYCIRMKEMDDTIKDAITLLQPLKRKDVNGEMYYETEDGCWDFKGFCPACNAVVRHISNRDFCGSCGQALKWSQIVFPEADNKVPVQSLIDHIKTATDVDPWAQAMAEKLLKRCDPKKVNHIEDSTISGHKVGYCPSCCRHIVSENCSPMRFCIFCGQELKWE